MTIADTQDRNREQQLIEIKIARNSISKTPFYVWAFQPRTEPSYFMI